MRESVVEKVLRDGIKDAGGYAPKWTSPGNAGVPDRIVIMPGGRIYFVELKAPGKQPSALQVLWLNRLKALGHDARIIDNAADARAFIREVTA